tara:strand:+ start:949 stop:1158 length:210 start_codon:yes stop_codon:yes gene_type:complete
MMVDLNKSRENFKIETKRKYRMVRATMEKIGVNSYEEYLIEELIKAHWKQFSHIDYEKLLEALLHERTN